MRSGRESFRRELRRLILNAIVAIVFLILMINVVIAWAVNSMADGFVRQIEATQET